MFQNVQMQILKMRIYYLQLPKSQAFLIFIFSQDQFQAFIVLERSQDPDEARTIEEPI